VRQTLSDAMAANADRLKLFPVAASQYLRDGEPREVAAPAGRQLPRQRHRGDAAAHVRRRRADRDAQPA
jgi:hypothetical protein